MKIAFRIDNLTLCDKLSKNVTLTLVNIARGPYSHLYDS
jgi:hypothetical protein